MSGTALKIRTHLEAQVARREVQELFPSGIGIHHAGMLRSDRNLMERAFASGLLKARLLMLAYPSWSPAPSRPHANVCCRRRCCAPPRRWPGA